MQYIAMKTTKSKAQNNKKKSLNRQIINKPPVKVVKMGKHFWQQSAVVNNIGMLNVANETA